MSEAIRFQNLGAWTDWLGQLNPDRIELGLQRVQVVWEQLRCPITSKVVTVAGTNGKGSVVAMLEQALLGCGRTTIAYTSPHLLRFNERVRSNGTDVDDASLVQALNAVARAAAASGQNLTYFEYITLAALWLIADLQPDVAVLEVGLGGRLDAVNSIAADAAVITSIGLDHQQWLGTTRASIATEKVHIARPGKVLICGEPDAPAEIGDHARRIAAPVLQINRDFAIRHATGADADMPGAQFQAAWLQQPLAVPALRMPGEHQWQNAATALALLTWPDSPVYLEDQQATARLVAATRLAGRQQLLACAPQLMVDVAHNEQAVAALVAELQQSSCSGRTWLVFAMLADKDVAAVIHRLLPLSGHWLLPQIPGKRAMPPAQMQQLLLAAGVGAETIARHDSVPAAVASALQQADACDRIVVLGSFVTAAEYLSNCHRQ